jgi:glutathione-regulated potassium-efflux system ancillary protein KefF
MTARQRILVIYAHSAPHRSRVNRQLAEAARSLGVLVHDLYETYPDFYIDPAREQALIAQSDLLAFLYPLRWYSVPSLLKEWYDVVFEPGWAHGRGGDALRGKRYWLVVTTGSPIEAFSPGGMHGRPLSDFLAPCEQTAALCGMEWLMPHVLYGANVTDDATVAAHVAAFRERLMGYLHPELDDRLDAAVPLVTQPNGATGHGA